MIALMLTPDTGMAFLSIGAACTLAALAGCAGTDTDVPPLDADVPPLETNGTFYHIHADVAGTYETAGSNRKPGANGVVEPCTWERVTAPYEGIAQDHNRIAAGTVRAGKTARVTVRAGEYFMFQGCKPWRYVGP